jgi:hypothetical protein
MAGHFGAEYEVAIGKVKANALLSKKKKEAPKIGYEIDIAYVGGNPLRIMNISGQLYIASNSVKVKNWKAVFNFDPATLDFITPAN